MKMIRRYATVVNNRTNAAGVYVGAMPNYVFDVRFNLILRSVTNTAYGFDSVTNQAINGFSQAIFRPNNLNVERDNPGLIDTAHQNSALIATALGQTGWAELYINMTGGENLTITQAIYLSMVTANATSIYSSFIIGYDCPEDYLSVEAFKTNV